MRSVHPTIHAFLGALACAGTAYAQTPPWSAPITAVRYEIAFDAAHAADRSVGMTMTFDVAGSAPVLLSLPAWTPGAYEISNFARRLSGFTVTTGAGAATWDRIDPDTWRIRPAGKGTVSVRYDVRADTLDNAMAWTGDEFLMANGTNLFLYPEGADTAFASTVSVRTEPQWRIATPMRAGAQAGTFAERSYHDLVDMPFFVGRFDIDSVDVDGRWSRVASYPAGILRGPARELFHEHIRDMMRAEAAVFGVTPWESYTTMIVFAAGYGGGSALEHQSSHLGIYDPGFIDNPVLPLITAHEIFHAWNVKRLRPADMTPYRYDRMQPTTLLWVSEGITDYYADLAMVRSGVFPDELFYAVTSGKMATVDAAPALALEDISLAAWIHPTDGSDGLYYPKGSLAGLALDIMIRDASKNAASLDDVMRDLYATTYRAGRGFTMEDFQAAVTRAARVSGAAATSFTDFYAKHVDGREPIAWDRLLPLAGMRLGADTTRAPRIGIETTADSTGVRVARVLPGTMGERAGIRAGDILLTVGGIRVTDQQFGDAYRERFRDAPDGTPVEIEVERGDELIALDGLLRFEETVVRTVEPDANPSPAAAAIREGILRGRG